MTQSLMSDALRDAVIEQLGHEKLNANIYLYLCGYLRNKGLNRIATHFLGQHDEETGHAKLFFDLLTDLNAEVRIPEIDEVNIPISSILDIAKAYLEREVLTTQSIDALKKLAIDENNPVCEEMFRGMIVKQQNEYAEALDFQDKAELTQGDWKFVLLWDAGLA
jgi:ferritin